MHIIGVDFSGAEPETGKTWIAEGSLSDDGLLTLTCCHPITRADLTNKLATLRHPAVVAMDFPFSVPMKFAPRLSGDAQNMVDLWAKVSCTNQEVFNRLRDSFVLEGTKAPPRKYDPKGSFSPLSITPINMVPMTFWGMRMLNDLYPGPADKPIWVPPLQCPPTKPHITLLEVMPGATLRRLGLPYRGYKGGQNPLKTRDKILRELSQKVISLTPLPHLLTLTCRANDDALDAVVAAITAALWHTDKSLFCHPPEQDSDVLLEGWMWNLKERNDKSQTTLEESPVK